ncbi:hypothetical protein ACX9I7_01190 [Streptomyces sp. L500]
MTVTLKNTAGLHAVWEITFHEAADPATSPETSGSYWVTTCESRPEARQRSLIHQMWLYLNQTQPDLPDLDYGNAHVRLLGYSNAKTGERVHSVACQDCGSSRVTFTVRDWANCGACGLGQEQGATTYCSDFCEECEAAALA